MPGNWTGVRDALEWPPFCSQRNIEQYDYLTKTYNYRISEDCLFLNVWSPHDQLTNQRKNSNTDLMPVIVFIHGGGFNFMGISMESFNGATVAAIGKVVFVTINYRLGLFGFFNNELESTHSGYVQNAGLHDQLMAIQWVKDNIRHFGGLLRMCFV